MVTYFLNFKFILPKIIFIKSNKSILKLNVNYGGQPEEASCQKTAEDTLISHKWNNRQR